MPPISAILIDRNGRHQTAMLEQDAPYYDVAFLVESKWTDEEADASKPVKTHIARFVRTQVVLSDGTVIYVQRW